jgi:hypothetical protein
MPKHGADRTSGHAGKAADAFLGIDEEGSGFSAIDSPGRTLVQAGFAGLVADDEMKGPERAGFDYDSGS